MNKVKLALVGKDVSKSASGKIHNFILAKLGYACEYSLVSLKEEEFEDAIPRLLNNFDGFNVTMPYKLKIIPYLDELCGDAKVFHSINTVVSRTKKGYNTDGVGFMKMLEVAGVEVGGKGSVNPSPADCSCEEILKEIDADGNNIVDTVELNSF